MEPQEDHVSRKIAQDPRYRMLLKRRARFTWTLTGVIVAVFFGYVLTIAFRPDLLATPIWQGAATTWGIPVGLGVILVGIALTGIYVRRANREFDPLVEAIRKDAGE